MFLRRLIALLCTSVYLLAAGGTAVASLTCPCVDLHRHTTACCHGCSHDHAATADLEGVAYLKASCCDNHHSNEIQLYTASGEQTERRAFRAAMQSLVADPSVIGCAVCAALCGEVRLVWRDDTPPLLVGATSPCGLRAPPRTV